jgi:hypothetical protein
VISNPVEVAVQVLSEDRPASGYRDGCPAGFAPFRPGGRERSGH